MFTVQFGIFPVMGIYRGHTIPLSINGIEQHNHLPTEPFERFKPLASATADVM
jgi:hypothetical protein